MSATVARTLIDQATSEIAWQQVVVEMAGYLGYRVFHDYDARLSEPGFPDLICVRAGADSHPGRLVALELKRESGKPTTAQCAWIDALSTVPGCVAMIARPSDFETVRRVLEGGR